MKLYVGMDIQPNDTSVVIINENGLRVLREKLANELPRFISMLEGYRENISDIVVDGSPIGYWLIDGLRAAGYKVCMANSSANKQFKGMRHVADYDNAQYIAELKRIGLLKECYVYPKEDKPMRDLLRRRLLQVQDRTTHMHGFQNLYAETTGKQINSNDIENLKLDDVGEIFLSEVDFIIAKGHFEMVMFLDKSIKEIEEMILPRMNLKPEFQKLLTIPGVGNILSLTIALETGDIKRFKKVGNYSSYARCVKAMSIQNSNDQTRGKFNRKNGNKYLALAFTEAACLIRRHCPYAETYFQRKASRSAIIIARKALVSKVSKLAYHIMDKQSDYDPVRAFGRISIKKQQE